MRDPTPNATGGHAQRQARGASISAECGSMISRREPTRQGGITEMSAVIDSPGFATYALCTAILAAARIDGFSAHCPQSTGAEKKAILGMVTIA